MHVITNLRRSNQYTAPRAARAQEAMNEVRFLICLLHRLFHHPILVEPIIAYLCLFSLGFCTWLSMYLQTSFSLPASFLASRRLLEILAFIFLVQAIPCEIERSPWMQTGDWAQFLHPRFICIKPCARTTHRCLHL